jgi:hypothetical protein
LCFSEKPILPGFPVTLELKQTSMAFRIMTNTKPHKMTGNRSFKIFISEATVLCPVASIQQKLYEEIDRRWKSQSSQKKPIAYPYRYSKAETNKQYLHIIIFTLQASLCH